MDRYFGESSHSVGSLFRDLQRQVLKQLLRAGLADTTDLYHKVFEQNQPLMRFLRHLAAPLPLPMQAAAEVLFNTDLRWALKDDDPDFEQIRRLVSDARTWGVRLDANGLSYRFTRMLDRAAFRWKEQPQQIELLLILVAGIDLARELPFEINLWMPQNVFFDVAETTFLPRAEAAKDGDEAAGRWVDAFLTLGQKLGVNVEPLKKKWVDLKVRPTAAALVAELIANRHVPLAAYRLQFSQQFPFTAGTELVPYLADLGVSDVYSSPILQARPGSPHGYDICDHSRISSDLGGEDGFSSFADALRRRQMGIILDVVPNHMAVLHPSNLWWADVLENGPSSRFARYFDIDWDPVNRELASKVLLPVLGEQYGQTLETGKLRLAYDSGSFFLTYYESRFPVAPRTYAEILSAKLDLLSGWLGEDHDHLLEYRSIITALGHLPARTALGERQAERYREMAIVKRRLAALVAACPEVRAAVTAALELFNGRIDFPDSFDLMDRLISGQSYRPAFWRVAVDEINYRRFFDINELAAIRVEFPEVFDATHEVPLRLLAEGKVRGLRVDHPDGLYTPARYFRHLQERYAEAALRPRIGGALPEDRLRKEIAAALDAALEAGQFPPLYIVAEKILGDEEVLPRDWLVDGTTGYEFLNALNGLFVAPENEASMERAYVHFCGHPVEFAPLVRSCKQAIMQASMSSEVTTLGHQLDQIAERHRRYRDFTLSNLRFALREFIAWLTVYRTYTTPDGVVSDRDRGFVEAAIEPAKRLNPRIAEDVFDFIRDTVLLRNLTGFPEADRPVVIDWVMRLQQVTGPVMAKGIEDTAFYVYNRLVSLNEVGGHPEKFGGSVAAFHRQNGERAAARPNGMLTTSTHDTKRGEDARARINVLSEFPEEWQQQVTAWRKLLAEAVSLVDCAPAPSPNDQYVFFQSHAGSWPDPPPSSAADLAAYRDRLLAYMQKATKEAKQNTSWVNPNKAYDEAIRRFVSAALADPLDGNPFLAAFRPFGRRVAFFGRLNSLAQVLLKLTSPGVPDIYQGNEIWDLSLVDPDNRRPVDFPARKTLLDGLRPLLDADPPDLPCRVGQLLERASDGRIKLYLTAKTLRVRRHQGAAYTGKGYEPVAASGAHAGAVCAFLRGEGQEKILTAVCTHPTTVSARRESLPIGETCWTDTFLAFQDQSPAPVWRNELTGQRVCLARSGEVAGLWAKDVFAVLPVALLAPI
jgi:(1->4)-alpha-D-glucan 1-alpha-D-glucosylmutase